MGEIYTGEADHVNESNLTPERLPLTLALQKDLMSRFASLAHDKDSAALEWVSLHAKDFRILIDQDPQLVDRYQDPNSREDLLKEIEARLVH